MEHLQLLLRVSVRLPIAIIFVLLSEVVLINGAGPIDLVFLNNIPRPAIADPHQPAQLVLVMRPATLCVLESALKRLTPSQSLLLKFVDPLSQLLSLHLIEFPAKTIHQFTFNVMLFGSLIHLNNGHFFILLLYPIHEVEDRLLRLESFFCLSCTDGNRGQNHTEKTDIVEELVIAEGTDEKHCHQRSLEVKPEGVTMLRVQQISQNDQSYQKDYHCEINIRPELQQKNQRELHHSRLSSHQHQQNASKEHIDNPEGNDQV
jgi:hypothetical protein